MDQPEAKVEIRIQLEYNQFHCLGVAMKAIFFTSLLLLLSACGIKSLVVPYFDWILTSELSEQLTLNSKQKRLLNQDVKHFLDERKTQAKRVLKHLNQFKEEEKIEVERWQNTFYAEYLDFLKGFLPMYSKYLAMLDKSQLKDLRKKFEDENEELSESIEDEPTERILERFEKNLGHLREEQKKTLNENLDNFVAASRERLKSRKEYQKSLLKLLEKELASEEKQSQIYKMTWDYNTRERNLAARQKNIETVTKVFNAISEKQKKHLRKKVESYKEWIRYYLKEDYAAISRQGFLFAQTPIVLNL